MTRCVWVTRDADYIAYHDQEWGVPVFDEHRLFEFLVLEGAQAGLAWLTVLKKRSRYREVFEGFDPERVARFEAPKRETLLADAGIIRNRAKIDAAIGNARAWQQLKADGHDPVRWLWSFVGGEPHQNAWRAFEQVPTTTPESHAMSRALRQRGFRFVGPTICYAFMQAVGMVNDHEVYCPRHAEVARLASGGAP